MVIVALSLAGRCAIGSSFDPASPHDSQVAIPLTQMTSERARILYDLADAAYDAPEIKDCSGFR